MKLEMFQRLLTLWSSIDWTGKYALGVIFIIICAIIWAGNVILCLLSSHLVHIPFDFLPPLICASAYYLHLILQVQVF
jgi:hypothetical protein